LIGRPLAILGTLLFGWLATWLVRRIVVHGVNRLLVRTPSTGPAVPIPDDTHGAAVAEAEPAVPTREDARPTTRAHAVAVAVSSTLSARIWVIVVIVVLAVLGLDVEPIIAGAGLAGVALAFGAQSLIKDLLNGIFILLEDHFGIGDEVQLGQATGVVEKMTLRETVLRDLDGTVWHVRNGEIDKAGNFSQVWSGALIDISVVYDTDVSMARSLQLEAADKVNSTPPFVDEV
jgi:small conductance mechanosensitive channel